MDSSAIAAICALANAMRNGGKLGLVHPQPTVAMILDIIQAAEMPTLVIEP